MPYDQEGYIEELPARFYFEKIKSSKILGILTETYIFNVKMVDSHFKS